MSLLTLAVGRYALNYSYVLAIPSQAKLAPYEPDRGSQKIRQVSTCRIFLSIAKAMVYHHDAVVDIITEGVYHQP